MNQKQDKTKSINIKSWPPNDRPREKLLKNGPSSLSNSELLAIILQTGTIGVTAIDLARDIINKFGTFRNMVHTDVRDWKEFKGLGNTKIARMQALFEISKRFYENEISVKKAKIISAKDIIRILMPRMRDLKTEIFNVIYLDNDNRIIQIEEEAKGTVNQTFPIIREIIHKALQKFALSIICVHNHPGSNIEPSTNDKEFTKKLCDATNLIGMQLLDHIIIGNDDYFSFASSGLI